MIFNSIASGNHRSSCSSVAWPSRAGCKTSDNSFANYIKVNKSQKLNCRPPEPAVLSLWETNGSSHFVKFRLETLLHSLMTCNRPKCHKIFSVSLCLTKLLCLVCIGVQFKQQQLGPVESSLMQVLFFQIEKERDKCIDVPVLRCKDFWDF